MDNEFFRRMRDRKMLKHFGITLDEFLNLNEEEQNILLISNYEKIRIIRKVLKDRRNRTKDVTKDMVEQEKSINERIDNLLRTRK